MLGTADDIALALVRIADRRGEPTVEHLIPLLSGLSRRERAVLAGFFERLAEEERAAPAPEAERDRVGANPRRSHADTSPAGRSVVS